MAASNNRNRLRGELYEAIHKYKINKIHSLVTNEIDLSMIRTAMEQHRRMRGTRETKDTTPLFTAVCFDHREICRRLIEEGVDVNAGFLCDLPPLSVALERKNYELAKELIKSGADVNLLDKEGRFSPLHYAITNDSPVFIVKELIDAGFPKDGTSALRENALTKEKMKCPAIVEAILANNVPVVKYLLEQSVNIKLVSFEGLSPLGLAVKLGFVEVVSELIKSGARVEGETQVDPPPLLLAATSFKAETMKVLLDSGADVNSLLKWSASECKLVFGDEARKTPLHVAVNLCNFKVVKLLLERGANVNAALPITKTTPLHVMSVMIKHILDFQRKSYLQTLKVLLESGADMNAKDRTGLTPLEATLSLSAWDAESMEIWVRNGADVNKPVGSMSIFQLAIRYNMPSLIEVCLSFGADCSSKSGEDSSYRLVLKFCNRSGMRIFLKYGFPYNDYPSTVCYDIPENPDKMRILPLLPTHVDFIKGIETNDPTRVKNSLKGGAVAKTCSVGLRHPLHFAASKGFREIVKILLREGVSPCSLDESRMTPLHVAAQAGHWQVCEALLQHGACHNCAAGLQTRTPLQLSDSREVLELLEAVAKAFGMAKRGSVKLLDVLQKASEDEDNARFWALMNCVDRHFRSLMETTLHFGHADISKGIMNLRLVKSQDGNT